MQRRKRIGRGSEIFVLERASASLPEEVGGSELHLLVTSNSDVI